MEDQFLTNAPLRRWPLFLTGALLFLVGPVIYFFQLHAQRLAMPWYLPALATAGVLCMAASVAQRRGVLRTVGLVLFLVLCGTEWVVLGILSRTPAYVGPGQPGCKLPEFAATSADGQPFSNSDLEDGRRTVLVFFRGRW